MVEKLFSQHTHWFARHVWWEDSFCLVGNNLTCSHAQKSFWHSFVLKLVCKMVASNTLDFRYYKYIGRQPGRGFGALAQVFGRTIPFLRKYIVPAAKSMGDNLLELAVPEVADVVSGKKNFKTAAENVGRQTLRKQLGGGKQKRRISVKNLKRSFQSRRDISTEFAN